MTREEALRQLADFKSLASVPCFTRGCRGRLIDVDGLLHVTCEKSDCRWFNRTVCVEWRLDPEKKTLVRMGNGEP